MICVSLGNISFEELQKHLPLFDMVELRLDLLDFSNEQYCAIIEKCPSVIATYRAGKNTNLERVEALSQMMKLGVEYVDIEIGSDSYYLKEIEDLAKKHQCKIIFSYHNFTETPSKQELESIIQSTNKYQPNYIKLVTRSNFKSDVAKVLSLYENHQNLIAFCMGNLGKISRLASLYLGADFTYASITSNQETASGQFDYQTLKQLQKTINI